MTTPYFQVIAHYHAKAGEAGKVQALLSELAQASRGEPANLYYDFFVSTSEPGHFVILERYTDAAGFEAHRNSEHFQRIGFGQIIPLLDKREVSSCVVPGN
ncbi:putative quinol monooxygenase [Herbaspirillum robiniae]|uniref:Antibiotic biosynthesis monooxygenase n=1 Tax=Herbaspirillum robiniae TaxID=2014887 RepID=A0A2D0B6D5_9BURK|nr:putative quinol monooxygenase [Herbaspirillum robiniae]OWY29936.1 antibiotic biosynthesis monooxygenase [Herbaspirillum robiniae]